MSRDEALHIEFQSDPPNLPLTQTIHNFGIHQKLRFFSLLKSTKFGFPELWG